MSKLSSVPRDFASEGARTTNRAAQRIVYNSPRKTIYHGSPVGLGLLDQRINGEIKPSTYEKKKETSEAKAS